MTSGRHFNDLPNAATIKTETFLRTRRVVADCIRFKSLGVLVGEAGHGKTFAMDSAVAMSPDPVIKTLFSHQATPREVARQLIQCATGVPHKSGTRFDFEDDCVDLFREPHVAVIDEAQHLNRDCTFFLRLLLDHAETNVAIILVGGNGCWEKLCRDPMLRSRVYRRVQFGPVCEEDLLDAIFDYHPIYNGADREMLAELYLRYPLGQLRMLAIFTHTAMLLCQESDTATLNENVVEKALELICDDTF